MNIIPARQFFLLIITLSAILTIGNCQMIKALKTLRSVSELPKDTATNTILRLKNIINQSDIPKYKITDEVLILMEELTIELGKYDVNDTMEELSNTMVEIETISMGFHKFVRSTDHTTDTKILDEYFGGIWNDLEFITDSLERIRYLTTWKTFQRLDLFSLSGHYIREFNAGICDPRRLTLGHIWNFYNFLFDLEFKGSFILISTYQYLTVRNLEDHRMTVERALKNAERRFLEYSIKARGAMKNTTMEVLLCDDGNYVKDETYIELRGISQGFLINSAYIDSADNCNIHTPLDDLCIYNSESCMQQKCSELGGKVNNCKDISEGRSNLELLSTCPSEENGKRYRWAQLDGTYFGNHSAGKTCSKPLINYDMIRTYTEKYLFISVNKYIQRKICFCSCERKKWMTDDIRAISFEWTESDYGNNRVITDVKFVETNGIIQLKVQEGHLLPGGRIDQSSLVWIETPNAIPSSNSDKDAPDYSFREKNSFTEWQPDYNFEYISSGSSIIVNDITAPKNHVVIGITFQKIVKGDINAIELMIAAMECDFTSGKLNPLEVKLLSDYKTKPYHLDLGSPGNPINMKKLNNDFSKPNGIVYFQQTDWKKDLGQSFVPFFDIRPIEPKIAFPLSGVGLYHRGCKDCGGFFGLKLITYDISKNLGTN